MFSAWCPLSTKADLERQNIDHAVPGLSFARPGHHVSVGAADSEKFEDFCLIHAAGVPILRKSLRSSVETDRPGYQPSPIEAPEIARMLVEHRAPLLGYLLSCVRNHADAEDLLQDVSLAATKSAADLRDRGGFLPWAREIARRRVLAHFRKSKRLTPIDPELANRLADTAAAMDDHEDIPARVEALRECLEALPAESRKLIALRYEDHRRPVEEIAEQFGRTVQAAYAILKRCRLMLRDCVTQKLAAKT